MSIFAKKPEMRSDGKLEAEAGPAGMAVLGTTTRTYGIQEAIQLMRSLPVDQNAELVVRVVRATLGSVNVRVQDIIEDAGRKQQGIQEAIASLQTQIADLEKQLDGKRKEIAALETELKETSGVKEKLQQGEKMLPGTTATPAAASSAARDISNLFGSPAGGSSNAKGH
jgi:septal ring factor EnvC (AmiA/AmiB activator)